MGDELVLQPSPNLVTELLAKWRAGDQEARRFGTIWSTTNYERWHSATCATSIRINRLQSTALVHEAYLRLQKRGAQEFQNRAHFFAIAAQLMQQILVE